MFLLALILLRFLVSLLPEAVNFFLLPDLLSVVYDLGGFGVWCLPDESVRLASLDGNTIPAFLRASCGTEPTEFRLLLKGVILTSEVKTELPGYVVSFDP